MFNPNMRFLKNKNPSSNAILIKIISQTNKKLQIQKDKAVKRAINLKTKNTICN